MSNETTEPTFVDPNTDDLESFTELFNGKAQVKDEITEETGKTEDVNNLDEDEILEENADETSDTTEEEKEAKPKKVNRFQERINELTAKAKEAERREADLQRKLEEVAKQKPAEDKTPVLSDKDAALPSPDEKNSDGSDKYPLGEFDPHYIRDLTRITIQKEQAIAREQEQRDRVARQHQEARDMLQVQWAEKLETVTEQHEDFLDKTIQLESAFDGLDANYSDYLVQTIKSLDHGPEVLYYFANNLDEAKKFVQKGPLEATLALGEINALFKSGAGKKETKVSKASPPPQLNKGSKTSLPVAADTDDLDAFSDVFFKKK